MRQGHPNVWIACLSILAFAQPSRADAPIQPTGQNLSEGLLKKKSKDSLDISGIACRPDTGPKRACVVIDDQGKSAQIAFLEGGKLVGGQRFKLIAKHGDVRGAQPPGHQCQTSSKFEDLDGEGVAYAAPYFYVTGSHGCSRKGSRYSPSSFIVVRFRVDAAGQPLDAQGAPIPPGSKSMSGIEATYRLADALRVADQVGASFATTLQDEHSDTDGLNVEGVAVVDGVLLAGLRAPSIGGRAFLVGAKVEDLFAPGQAPLAAKPTVVAIDLGARVGIRDLSVLPDGRLVGISGPTRDEPATHYGLFLVDAPLGGHPMTHRLGVLADVPADVPPGGRAKAEALLPLGVDAGTLKAIVLFDGRLSGGANLYQVPLPRP